MGVKRTDKYGGVRGDNDHYLKEKSVHFEQRKRESKGCSTCGCHGRKRARREDPEQAIRDSKTSHPDKSQYDPNYLARPTSSASSSSSQNPFDHPLLTQPSLNLQALGSFPNIFQHSNLLKSHSVSKSSQLAANGMLYNVPHLKSKKSKHKHRYSSFSRTMASL